MPHSIQYYVNPSKSQTAIRQHLQQLVEEVELPEDRRQNNLPYKFCGINERKRDINSLTITNCCVLKGRCGIFTTKSRRRPKSSATSLPPASSGDRANGSEGANDSKN